MLSVSTETTNNSNKAMLHAIHWNRLDKFDIYKYCPVHFDFIRNDFTFMLLFLQIRQITANLCLIYLIHFIERCASCCHVNTVNTETNGTTALIVPNKFYIVFIFYWHDTQSANRLSAKWKTTIIPFFCSNNKNHEPD